VLAALWTPAVAATLSLPPNAGAPPGAGAVVSVVIDDAAGILGADIVIAYDPGVAVPTGVSATSVSSSHNLNVNLSPPGQIRISLYGFQPLSGGGPLLDIAFTSVGPAGSASALDLVSVDLNEGGIPAALADGAYCVQERAAEVQNLRVRHAAPGSATAVLTWDPVPFALGYNLYRAGRADLSDLGCLLDGLTSTSVADDGSVPLSGRGFFYLATARNCHAESTLGFRSSGAERPNVNPCP
jgi:hypothetical protein